MKKNYLHAVTSFVLSNSKISLHNSSLEEFEKGSKHDRGLSPKLQVVQI